MSILLWFLSFVSISSLIFEDLAQATSKSSPQSLGSPRGKGVKPSGSTQLPSNSSGYTAKEEEKIGLNKTLMDLPQDLFNQIGGEGLLDKKDLVALKSVSNGLSEKINDSFWKSYWLKNKCIFESKTFDPRLFEKRVQNGETIESKFDEVFKYCQHVEIVNSHLPSYFLNSLPVGIKHLTITNPIINKEIVDEKKSAEHLAQYLSRNKGLELFSLKHATLDNSEFEKILNGLNQNQSLLHLDLGRTSLTNQGIGVDEAVILAAVVQKNKLLQHLNLEFLQLENQAAVIINALKDHKFLKYFNFGGNQINDEGVKVLAEILLSKPSLRHLNLGNNPITSQGVELLVNALKKNTTLETLILRRARIHGEEKAVAKALGELIKDNGGIISLDLSHIYLSSSESMFLRSEAAGIASITEGLKNNTTLQTLDLGGNSLGDKGAETLAEALEINKSLRHLLLYLNSIGDSGVTALAKTKTLSSRESGLLELNLGHNNIKDKGAIAIAEALRKIGSLQDLVLGFNQIGDEGAKALVNALSNNTTLKDLSVGRLITEAGANVLAKILEGNKIHLKILGIWSNNLLRSVKAASAKLQEAARKNNITLK